MKLIEDDDQNFSLPGTSSRFNERKKSIFDELDKAVKDQPQNRYSTEEFLRSETRAGRVVSTCRKEFKQFLGQESIFKRPEVQPKKNWKRKMPDFQKNPHKWTKYSLEDVSQDQMSDQSNAATAMAFMKELSNRNSDQERMVVDIPAPKIIFNKHVKLMKDSEPVQEKASGSVDKPTFVSGKYVMPEYVVGQKVKTKKSSKKPSELVKTQIKLDHLLEQDEEN